MKGYCIETLKENLSEINRDEFFLIQNVEDSWNYLYNGYVSALDKIAPSIQVNNCRPKPYWVKTELLELIRERDRHKQSSDSLNNNDDAMDRLLSYTYGELNQNKTVLTIFTTYLNHKILLSKVKGAGLTGKCLKLISNSLENRKRKSKVNEQLSNVINITCGVPQGSNLGPLLFIIYMNDLVAHITNVKMALYADDTAVF